MSSSTEQAVARGIVDSVDGDRLVLRVPHTDYRLRLTRTGAGVLPEVGKRVRGTICGQALRMHPASGGGRFIEPVIGEPRIVAGTVLAIDDIAKRVLVDVSVPMWLMTESAQDFTVIRLGELVNCYVQSGATFEVA